MKKTRSEVMQGVQDYSSVSIHSSRELIVSFAIIIMIGTVLLSLPIATTSGKPLDWRDALFTATSATTVTGLVITNTVETFSMFGEIVILGLIQVGGIGFVILSVVLLRLIGRRVTLEERAILRQILGVNKSQGIVQLALSVTLITVGIELVGAFFLFISWVDDLGPAKAAYYAIFHAISAFCNAGFDLFHNLDDPLVLLIRRDPISVFTLSTLIIIGTLGIAVVYDLITYMRSHHLSLHSRLILPLIIFLTTCGTILLLADETITGNILSTLSLKEQWLTAFFTVVSSRTAGITIIPLQALGPASQSIVLVFMFIGGAPASMGGGVGLTSVAVVLVTLYDSVSGFPDVRVWKRTLPTETVFKAVAIITVSTILVMSVTLGILLIDNSDPFAVAFEVVSAFSNTGYSLGITSSLNHISRGLLIFTMFWGRLGPLTLVVALAQRNKHTQLNYPEERIIIG